jgi:hypothetical protein
MPQLQTETSDDRWVARSWRFSRDLVAARGPTAKGGSQNLAQFGRSLIAVAVGPAQPN